MYIEFDEYPRYSDRLSAIFEKKIMEIFNAIMILLILQVKKIVHVG